MTVYQFNTVTEDRTEGRNATEAMSGSTTRLAELLAAIAKDGSAGQNVLALVSDMAREVSVLAAELVEDGVLSRHNPFLSLSAELPGTPRAN